MAYKDLQKRIGKTFKTSKEVSDSVFKYGTYVNCDFSNLDLFTVDLTDCTFDACKFKKTRLGQCQNSKFYSCDLTGANANDANFSKCLAINCRADGLKMTGTIISVDCHFISGLITENVSDGASLLYWVTQLQNKYAQEIRQHLLDTMPPHVRSYLEIAFERDPAA